MAEDFLYRQQIIKQCFYVFLVINNYLYILYTCIFIRGGGGGRGSILLRKYIFLSPTSFVRHLYGSQRILQISARPTNFAADFLELPDETQVRKDENLLSFISLDLCISFYFSLIFYLVLCKSLVENNI